MWMTALQSKYRSSLKLRQGHFCEFCDYSCLWLASWPFGPLGDDHDRTGNCAGSVPDDDSGC